MDVERLLHDSADRVFAALPAETVGAWRGIEEVGFLRALSLSGDPDAPPPRAACAVLRVAAAHAVALPVAETMLATALLAATGLAVPDGMLGVTTGPRERVAWGRDLSAIVAMTDRRIACVPRAACDVAHGTNLAGEPRDIVRPRTMSAAVASPFGTDAVRAVCAALRTQQIAGAGARVLEITLDHARTRAQFGRPIGGFQAVQHLLAQLAAEAAAATAAADIAADALAPPRLQQIAAAKARAGEAAGRIAAISHQVLGAIGFTQEHALHRLTRRLWSWRDEFGNEAEWSRSLGERLLRAGPDALWEELTA